MLIEEGADLAMRPDATGWTRGAMAGIGELDIDRYDRAAG
jgi:hypothetical protein